MENIETMFKKAICLVIGGSVIAVEKTSQFIEELPEQVELFTEEMVNRGEKIYQEWSQENSSEVPFTDFFQTPNTVNTNLRNKLFSLTGGSKDLAARLLAQVRQRYPGNSEIWYYEKVIYDLERDR